MTVIDNELDTPAALGESSPDDTFHTAEVATIAFAHGAHDMFFSFIPPLQPLLMEKLALTNAQAGLFTLFLQGPSLFQPLIGHMADRRNLRVLIILAPTLSGLALTLVGLAPNYGILALLMLIAGFSTAGLHSIAPVLIAARSGKKIGRGMGLFMVGGELGVSIGPLVVVAVVGAFSLSGLPWLCTLGLLCSVIVYARLKNMTTVRPVQTEEAVPLPQMLLRMRAIMLPIVAYIFITSFLYANIVNFLPTFLKSEGASFALAGGAYSIIEIAGTIGVLLSSWLSDRIGQRRIILIATVWMVCFSLLFLNTQGWLQIAMLVGVGLLAFSSNPAFLAIVQNHFAANRSLANGLYMAASFVVRSLVVFLVGFLADRFGLRTVFTFSVWGALLALPFAFLLPKK